MPSRDLAHVICDEELCQSVTALCADLDSAVLAAEAITRVHRVEDADIAISLLLYFLQSLPEPLVPSKWYKASLHAGLVTNKTAVQV